MDFLSADNYSYARLVFEKALAALYLIGFIVALNQFPALLGEKGLLPATEYLRRIPFWSQPTLFQWHYSDQFFKVIAWLGIAMSLLIIFGVMSSGPIWVSIISWLFIWVLYLSIVNIGQTFYSFGWESMLLEAGFFAAFLGPSWVKPSYVPIVILYWMLFRTEVGAGLIKLRGDPCWKDLTCLYYHHETQPMPNPLSWYFHHLPKGIHRSGALFSHFVQLIAPFALFLPQPLRTIGAGFIIIHQMLLVVSGNYSWLNWLTIVLALLAIPNSFIEPLIGFKKPISLAERPLWFDGVLYGIALMAIILSIKPALNLISRDQLMNYCWNRFHLVCAYGAFGSVTKERYEIVIEGTGDTALSANTQWKEYEFKGKPGDPAHRPSQFAPYHLRLDWLMWFLPFSVTQSKGHLYMPGYELWFLRLTEKLLQGDKPTLKLIKYNPFVEQPPRFIRARYYLYKFTEPEEHKQTGNWWKRTWVADYLPPISREELSRALP